MDRVFFVMKKEFIQTFRDKRMIAIIFIAPIIQLFIFGYAVTTEVENVNVGLLNYDEGPYTRRIVEAFTGSGYFTLVGSLDNDDQLRRSLRDATIDMALVIPADFERKVSRGTPVSIQAVFDGSDSNSAQIAGSYTEQIIGSISRDLLLKRLTMQKTFATQTGMGAGMSPPQINPQVRVWYNPDLKSANYMVPGVVALLLLVVTILLTGMAITREKEIGTLEQIMVSPISRWQLILGKLLPFAILGFVDVFLIVTAARWHFGVPFRGSLLLLLGSSGLFLFSTLGLGLFFSAFSSTQQQAMFITFMFLMPAILLSGFMFPIENMPQPVQYLTYLNPLRYFLVVIRGIFLKGNGIDVLWPQLASMAIFGVAIFTLASRLFTKRLS